MDQVSKPLLGLLLATVGLAGTWMVALRPHGASTAADAPLVPPPAAVAPKHTAPGAAGLGRAVDKAKGAAAASERSNAKAETAAGQAPTHDSTAVGAGAAKPAAPAKATAPAKPATPVKAHAPAKHPTPVKTHAPAKPVVTAPVAKAPAKPAPAKPVAAPKATTQPGSARVNAALSQGKSVVLLFAGRGADDSVARDVVRSVGGPRVVTIIASINDLGKYADVTDKLDVTAAPTIVVIAPSRQATEIVGLPDVKQVQSALRTLR